MHFVKKLTIGLALGYLALLLFMYFGQEKILFPGVKLPASHAFAKPGVVEVTVEVPGATLSALHYKQPRARGVVFFLHGNSGNVDTWLAGTDFYSRAGFDLFMLDYRGYGRSTGKIENEAQLHADVRAAYDRVAQEYAGRPIVLLGRSLGTGLAAQLAADVQPPLTVLVSAFSSMHDMVRQQYPFVPTALLRYPLRTNEYLPRISKPVLLIHGEADLLIPIVHSERLLRVANPKTTRLERIPQAGHNDIQQFEQYTEALSAALRRF